MKKVLAMMFALTLVLTGCGGAGLDNADGKKSGVTLNVYNWGDYIDPDVLDMFTDETGIKVNYENFNNNEELLAKIEAGSTNYDVLFPSDYMVGIMRKKGLLQKLDFENIKNVQYIDDRFKALSYDPDNEYNVPYMWQTVGIVYNREKVTDPVDTWDLLWNKKYSRKIIMLDSSRDTIGIALKRLGYSLNTTDDKELEEAKKSLIEQKPIVNSYQVDYYKTALIGGEADISLAWSGDAMYIQSENPVYEYSIPKEGTNVSIDCMVIPAQSEHKLEAEKFIDFMNKPEIAAKNAEYIMYSSPNTEAVKLLPKEFQDNKQMYPDGKLDEIGEIFEDLGDYNMVYDKIWTQIKTAD